jgi:hypothetical protein
MYKKDKLTISIDENLKKDYKDYCEKEGYKLSSRISVLIFKDMTYKDGEK